MKCNKCGTEIGDDSRVPRELGHTPTKCVAALVKLLDDSIVRASNDANEYAAQNAAVVKELGAAREESRTRGIAITAMNEVITASETKTAALVEAFLPSARLVWENGGYSGTSGNWPLVEAYGKLEEIRETHPDIYARIKDFSWLTRIEK